MTTLDRALETAIAGLATVAPPGLVPSVLIEVGLADGYAPISSPIGTLFVAWNGHGVSGVDAASDDVAFETAHSARTGRTTVRAASVPGPLAGAIERRLAGDRRVRIALDLRGHTAFELDVWHKALEIPRGEVRPYGWIAAEIGRPRAVRAVGTALGRNPVPLIVPCHRVVRTDGSIGQYSLGGPDNKRAILAAEGLDTIELESLARAGIRYVGSDTTHIVCLPTCRNARRITDRHRRPFRSLDRAAETGYRPCLACRPDSAARTAAA
jgi:O-6-methylguanine DNA methyltransferase